MGDMAPCFLNKGLRIYHLNGKFSRRPADFSKRLSFFGGGPDNPYPLN